MEADEIYGGRVSSWLDEDGDLVIEPPEPFVVAAARAMGIDQLRLIDTGLDPVMPLLKLPWMRKNEPERYAAAEKFLLIKEYIVALVGATRKHPDIYLGASPRGSLALYKAARAHAAVDAREFVIPDDVKKMAEPTLSHRLIVAYVTPPDWLAPTPARAGVALAARSSGGARTPGRRGLVGRVRRHSRPAPPRAAFPKLGRPAQGGHRGSGRRNDARTADNGSRV